MKILFTGGGTAGHIFPIIAVLREIRKIYSREDLRFYYIGPQDEFGKALFLKEGVAVKTILAGKMRRYFGFKSFFQNLADILFKIPIGFLQSLFYIFIISPDLIFSKGGYGSLPVVFSGWLLLTPVFLHESDAAPGLANRLMAKLSLEVFVSFAIEKMGTFFPSKKMISLGNPIREEVLRGDEEKAKEMFQLTGEKPVILVLGGSQGAQRINDVLLAVLPEILENFELIHQTGRKNFKEITAEANVVIDENLQRYYHPSPFLKEEKLKHAYKAAGLIVSRAGSGSIFEIAALGKPSILIPLPHAAQNHQLKNAYAYAETGACLVIEEENLTSHFFLERLKYLFSQKEKLKEMGRAGKTFSRPEAAPIIAEYIIGYLAGKN